MLYIGSLLIIEQTIATVCSKYQNIYPFHCVLIKKYTVLGNSKSPLLFNNGLRFVSYP